jgi:hypothetical protein
MVGWWRTIYYYLGWEYPEHYENRQQHLKHELVKQIKKTDNIKKILKTPKKKKTKKKKKKTKKKNTNK